MAAIVVFFDCRSVASFVTVKTNSLILSCLLLNQYCFNSKIELKTTWKMPEMLCHRRRRVGITNSTLLKLFLKCYTEHFHRASERWSRLLRSTSVADWRQVWNRRDGWDRTIWLLATIKLFVFLLLYTSHLKLAWTSLSLKTYRKFALKPCTIWLRLPYTHLKGAGILHTSGAGYEE